MSILSFADAVARRNAARTLETLRSRAQLALLLKLGRFQPLYDYNPLDDVAQVALATEHLVEAAIFTYEIAADDRKLGPTAFSLISEASFAIAEDLARRVGAPVAIEAARLALTRILSAYVNSDVIYALREAATQAYQAKDWIMSRARRAQLSQLVGRALDEPDDYAISRLADTLALSIAAVA